MNAREYVRHKMALVDYLIEKVRAEDWHGVRDAAVDIEVLEARYESQQNKQAHDELMRNLGRLYGDDSNSKVVGTSFPSWQKTKDDIYWNVFQQELTKEKAPTDEAHEHAIDAMNDACVQSAPEDNEDCSDLG